MYNLEIKFERRFLLEDLPAPLTRATEHLQFFDDYLTATRLWLRQIRTPQTRQRSRHFVQKYPLTQSDLSRFAYAEIELSEYEYEVLSVFEGNQLRYNRYYLTLESGQTMMVDMFLNRELWNLILATIEFATAEEMKAFTPTPSFKLEITQDDFFSNTKLVDTNIEQVRRKISQGKFEP
jgi:CYTH domain-containing protein